MLLMRAFNSNATLLRSGRSDESSAPANIREDSEHRKVSWKQAWVTVPGSAAFYSQYLYCIISAFSGSSLNFTSLIGFLSRPEKLSKITSPMISMMMRKCHLIREWMTLQILCARTMYASKTNRGARATVQSPRIVTSLANLVLQRPASIVFLGEMTEINFS